MSCLAADSAPRSDPAWANAHSQALAEKCLSRSLTAWRAHSVGLGLVLICLPNTLQAVCLPAGDKCSKAGPAWADTVTNLDAGLIQVMPALSDQGRHAGFRWLAGNAQPGRVAGHTEQLCVRAPGMLHGSSFRVCPAPRHGCSIRVALREGAGYPRAYGSAQAHVRPSARGPICQLGAAAC